MCDNLAYQQQWREELIGGEVVAMSPRPVVNHNRIAGNIFHLFAGYLKGRKCEPFGDGYDVYLTENDVYIPDFMVVCDPDKVKYDGIHGAPDLVAEVMSPSTMRNDKFRKKEVYAKCGVQEYWLIDPANKVVEVYYNSGTEFVIHDIYALLPDWELARMSEQDRAALITHFRCSLFDDLDISLEDVFYRTF